MRSCGVHVEQRGHRAARRCARPALRSCWSSVEGQPRDGRVGGRIDAVEVDGLPAELGRVPIQYRTSSLLNDCSQTSRGSTWAALKLVDHLLRVLRLAAEDLRDPRRVAALQLRRVLDAVLLVQPTLSRRVISVPRPV